ncbi:hypothetical protein VOM14_23465 [Paraburkholderia sp. MPAMCS5]|nr:hypothetical protein [Paraburkholderia sp. MPAMCS5]
MGRGLILDPYPGCAVLSIQTIVTGSTPAQRKCQLPRLANGPKRFAPVYS